MANSKAGVKAGRKTNYLEVCDAVIGAERADAAAFAEGLRAVIDGEMGCFFDGISLRLTCRTSLVSRPRDSFCRKRGGSRSRGPTRTSTGRKVAEEAVVRGARALILAVLADSAGA